MVPLDPQAVSTARRCCS